MRVLDLHGTRYHQAERLVEEFILRNDLPVKIITGNSSMMQSIVKDIVNSYNLTYSYESDWNLGALIIKE